MGSLSRIAIEIMDFLEDLRSRDLIAQLTHEDELLEHLQEKRTAYLGIDGTADSLHVGHLLALITMARWQRAGHKAIILLGSGTTMIGDPSGKTDMRKMLTREDIARNAAAQKQQILKLIDLNDPEQGIMVDNWDWLSKLNYLEFLRDIGPHFSVNRMLTAESVKQRLERGLSFLEFNYMLLQSYDFLELFRNENCTVQLGGDDQWSNMLGGVELVRRLGNKEAIDNESIPRAKAFCLTMPLLTTSDGRKMGKTEKGAVWLDPQKTSPFEFYQYWRNVEDDRVIRCMKQLTFMSMEEIKPYSTLKDAAINEAKKRLAFELTQLIHGEAEAKKAEDSAKALFESAGGASGNEPQFPFSASEFGSGMNVIDFLVAAQVFASKGEVRRLIKQGGLTLGSIKVTDDKFEVTKNAFEDDGSLLVKKGKKHYFRITFS